MTNFDRIDQTRGRQRTQISSKYSPDNEKLFAFKKLLESAELEVAFPVGSLILEYEQGFAITHPSEKKPPFHVSEIRFLREVKNNPVHIVYNINNNIEGYMGESTSIETAYAMLYQKPIIAIRDPFCAPTVPNVIAKIIQKRINILHIIGLDKCSPADVKAITETLVTKRVDYFLNSEEEEKLMIEIYLLCFKYSQSWKAYIEQRHMKSN